MGVKILKTISPREPVFWINEAVECKGFENESINCDHEALKHFLKALDITAKAFEKTFEGEDMAEAFPEFFKEFVYIRALASWEAFKAVSEDEKKELQEEMEKQKKEAEEYNKSLEEDEESFMIFDLIPEDPDINVQRFAKIMEKSPKQITEEEKVEAFELYPKVFALMR